MVTKATLKRKSINELENIRAYNESKVKELLQEIDDINTILAKKSQDETVKNGLYLVNGTQDIIAKVSDGNICQVFDTNHSFRINRQIAVRFEKGEMVCQLKNKKRKLTLMIDTGLGFYINEGKIQMLTEATSKSYMNKINYQFNDFLNYETSNKEILKIKNIFMQALAVLNTELNDNYTFNKDSLFKFLDLEFVKNLIDYQDVKIETVDRVWTLIKSVTFLNQEIFSNSSYSLKDNFKRYEDKNNKTDYEFILKNIVKPQKVNL